MSFDFFFLSSKLNLDLCRRAEIIRVGLNMHLYDDIGDASSSLRGSTSSLFLHPVSAVSLVVGRLNYWVVQAISAANVRGSVVRAHDVRKFAFSVNWARHADLQHILSYGFWASAHPFLSHYLTSCQSVFPAFVAAGSVVAASSGV